eukprot:7578973-Alexandrium_andersonii.AAC.1
MLHVLCALALLTGGEYLLARCGLPPHAVKPCRWRGTWCPVVRRADSETRGGGLLAEPGSDGCLSG